MATSVVYAVVINPNGTKKFLASGVSTFFINAKPTVMNGLRKFKNPPS